MGSYAYSKNAISKDGLNKLVEIDIDGVIGDLYTPIENIIRKEFPKENFSFEKDVHTFGMDNINPTIRNRIFELFKNPNIIKNEPIYNRADEFLIKLNNLLNNCGFQMIFHTYMLSDEVAYQRTLWLKRLINKLNLSKTSIVVDNGDSKNMIVSNGIIIEDCIENLINSKAKIKILKDMPHNKIKYNYKLLNQLNYYRINSYENIFNFIKNILN